MDSLEIYRQIIECVLSDYAAVPYAHGDFKTEVVFERTHDRLSDPQTIVIYQICRAWQRRIPELSEDQPEGNA